MGCSSRDGSLSTSIWSTESNSTSTQHSVNSRGHLHIKHNLSSHKQTAEVTSTSNSLQSIKSQANSRGHLHIKHNLLSQANSRGHLHIKHNLSIVTSKQQRSPPHQTQSIYCHKQTAEVTTTSNTICQVTSKQQRSPPHQIAYNLSSLKQTAEVTSTSNTIYQVPSKQQRSPPHQTQSIKSQANSRGHLHIKHNLSSPKQKPDLQYMTSHSLFEEDRKQ